MQAPWKRAAKIALAASCAVAVLSGCKQPAEQADDALRQQLSVASEQAGGSKSDPAVAVAYYQKAASTPGISSEGTIRAQLALASANARVADGLMTKIENRQAEIATLTTLINQQANRIRANNVQIAGLKALDPQAAQDALSKLQTSAQGGSDGAPWIAADAGAIPSSTGAKAKVASLKDQVDKLTTQKNNLQTQRARLVQQAEQLRIQSESAKGKESVDLFTQSANATKQAADIAIQSEGIDSQISAVQQDLAVAAAALKQVDASLELFTKQGEEIKQGWTEMQKVIQARSDQSATLLNAPAGDAAAAPADASASPGTAPSADVPNSIVAAAAAIDKLKGDNLANRDLAEKYLNDAMNALKSADTARAQVVRTYSTDVNEPRLQKFPQREAWQGMIDIHNPSDVKLSMALIDLRLARLYADWTIMTADRALTAKLLEGALTPASLTAPETLKAGSLDDELSSSRKKADTAFTDADQLLGDVQKTPAQGALARSAQAAAQAVQVIELYAHAKFSDAVGDTKAGQQLLTDCKELRDGAITAAIPLPSLPIEIAIAPVVEPTTTAPATAPVTPPVGVPAARVAPVFQTDQSNPPTPAPATVPAPAPTAAPTETPAVPTPAPVSVPAPAPAPAAPSGAPTPSN